MSTSRGPRSCRAVLQRLAASASLFLWGLMEGRASRMLPLPHSYSSSWGERRYEGRDRGRRLGVVRERVVWWQGKRGNEKERKLVGRKVGDGWGGERLRERVKREEGINMIGQGHDFSTEKLR